MGVTPAVGTRCVQRVLRLVHHDIPDTQRSFSHRQTSEDRSRPGDRDGGSDDPARAESDFEAWAAQVTDRVLEFEGCLNVGILKPGEPSGPYQIVFRFVDALSLRRWERSPPRHLLLSEIDEMVLDVRGQRTVGLEDWFDLAQRAEPKRAHWTRILIDIGGVYPVAVFISIVVAPSLVRMPVGLRTLVSAAAITVIMRPAIGPLRSRIRSRRRFG